MDWGQIFSRETAVGNLIYGILFTVAMTAISRTFFWIRQLSLDKRRATTFWLMGIIGWGLIYSVFVPRTIPTSSFSRGIYYLMVSEAPDHSGSVVGASIWLVNKGAPSIVTGWSGYLLSHEQRYPGVILPNFPAQAFLSQIATNPLAQSGQESSLITKTAETPLPSGGGANGMVFLYFQGLTLQFVNQPGNAAVFQFNDARGQAYTVSYPVGQQLFPLVPPSPSPPH